MLGKTHQLVGASLTVTHLIYSNQPGVQWVVPLVAVSIGSLLPDIDAPSSRMGRTFPKLSKWFYDTFGHRTLTHSAWVSALAIYGLSNTLDEPTHTFIFYISLGVLAHIVCDFFSKMRTPLLYPFVRPEVEREWLKWVPAYRTTGWFEIVLAFLLKWYLFFQFTVEFIQPRVLDLFRNI